MEWYASTNSSVPTFSQAPSTLPSPGTICAFRKRTHDTSTAAVRSSTSEISLSIPLRLSLGDVPFSIHMPGRVEPRPLLSLEGDVGPRLVGVTREQQALRHAKACIVLGESGCVDRVGHEDPLVGGGSDVTEQVTR